MKGIHNMKKILGIILGSTVVASTLLSFGVSAASASDFSDMPDDWSTAALTAAVDNGLLTGSDGMILPKDNLTRAQMATIISRAFGAVSTVELSDFTDVPEDKWYYEYMQKAVAMGVFTGDGSGLLTPDNNITREQVFAVLARAFKLEAAEGATLENFADKDSVSSWALEYACALVSNGYVKGSDDGTGALFLNPKSNITRAEFAQIMHNMVKTYIDEENATLSGEYEGGVIIRAKNVVVDETAEISGNLVISESAENVTISDEAVTGKLIDNRKVEDEKTDAETEEKTEDKEENKNEVWLTPGDNNGNTEGGNEGTGEGEGTTPPAGDNEGTGEGEGTTPPAGDNEGTGEGEGTTPPAGDGEGTGSENKPEIEFESNEGWSAIYKPGSRK